MATKTATTTQEKRVRVVRYTTYTGAALASYLEYFINACVVGFA